MTLIHAVIQLYIWVLVLSALLSWFPAQNGGSLATVKVVLARATEPVLRPLRQIVPRPSFGGVGVDFSVFIAILVLTIVNAYI